jgi:5-methylcytosine-specific restriction endonuclease McrA
VSAPRRNREDARVEVTPYFKETQLGRGPKKQTRLRAGKKRWEEIARAKQGPCRVCGGAPPNELHHLVPRAQGGADQNDNLVPLCHADHGRVTRYDREACAALRLSLTDAEYAYATEFLGEGRFESRYPVDWRKP